VSSYCDCESKVDEAEKLYKAFSTQSFIINYIDAYKKKKMRLEKESSFVSSYNSS
jgi:hypothetical protein